MRKVLELLREKYEKTYAEKTEVMIEKIMALMKVEESESGEKTWDKFYRLVSEFKKMNLNEHPRYMLGMIMIAGLEECFPQSGKVLNPCCGKIDRYPPPPPANKSPVPWSFTFLQATVKIRAQRPDAQYSTIHSYFQIRRERRVNSR